MARQKQKQYTYPYIRYSKRPDLAFALYQKRFKPITVIRVPAYANPAMKCHSLSELKDCYTRYGSDRWYNLDITKFSIAEQKRILSQLETEFTNGTLSPKFVMTTSSTTDNAEVNR